MTPPVALDSTTRFKLVDRFGGLSDRGQTGLLAWAQEFCEAHQRAPGGITIEVGTRIGGSACLFAELLWAMYHNAAPPLWTVDPYGSKPYVGGDTNEAPIYDTEMYLAAKHNLKTVPFHAHWLMTAVDFFSRMAGMSYWQPGPLSFIGRDVATGADVALPVGEEHKAGKETAAFILLDGEHSAESIVNETTMALFWLKPGGTIVIDNTDTDGRTVKQLTTALVTHPAADRLQFSFSEGFQWCVVRKKSA